MEKNWGYLPLQCSECKTPQQISLLALYNAWNKSRLNTKQTPAKEEGGRRFAAKIKCYCGKDRKYDGPMYNYIFRLIFETISEEKTTE